MKIDVECILDNGEEATIAVDLDYVSDMQEVYEWIDNEPEAVVPVKFIKNEEEIQEALESNSL